MDTRRLYGGSTVIFLLVTPFRSPQAAQKFKAFQSGTPPFCRGICVPDRI